MKSKFKRVLSFMMALCLLFTTAWTVAIVASAEGEVWEETYYGTPLDYYAGGAKAISLSDSSFTDWAGQDLIEIDSSKHPENWQSATHGDDIVYRYALAWDTTNLYFYIEIDDVMTNLTATAPRLWLDITPATTPRTGLVDFQYDEVAETMVPVRADCFNGDAAMKAAFLASIDSYAEEVEGTTYMEAAIPWAGMNETFTPEDDAQILYNVSVLTANSDTSVYAQDTSVWHIPTSNAAAPWTNSTEYLTMHFATGTAVLPEVTPTPLATSAIITEFVTEENKALGKSYTGTEGTRAGWIDDGTLLTNGVFGDINTIGGTVFAGWQGGGIGENAGTLTPDVELDGTIVKIIDLGEVVEGMHKFVASSGQVAAFGISFPDDVTFYASANGLHYQLLGSGVAQDYNGGEVGGQFKETQNYVVELEEGIAARYIKAVITPPEDDYVIAAIGEIAAFKNEYLPSGDVPIGNVNAYWLSAEMAATDNGVGGTYAVGQLANIYTDVGETVGTLCGGTYLSWWTVGVYEWNDIYGAYELTYYNKDMGDTTKQEKADLVVPENGFVIATHGGMNPINDGNLIFREQSVGAVGYLYGDATVGYDISTLAPQTNLIGRMTLSLITEVDGAYSPFGVKFDAQAVVSDAALTGVNVAEGNSYTASVVGENPLAAIGSGGNYLDDGIKLTDGTVATAYNVDTVGFYRADYGYVTVDLEEASALSAFRMAFWQQTGYGIGGPDGISVSVSDDGETWTYLGEMDHTPAEGLTYATLILPYTITARYVKYTTDCGAKTFVFASEVIAVEYDPTIVPIEVDFFVSHFNESEEGAGVIYNSKFGETVTNAWWNLVQFTWNEAGYYEVTATDFRGGSGQTAPMAIPENGFVYGVNHGNNYPALVAQGYTQYEGLPNYTNAYASPMMTSMQQFEVGEKVYFYGFDPEYEAILDGAENEVLWYEDGYECNIKAVRKVPKASVEAELGAYFTPHESFSVTNIGAYVTTGTTSIYTSDVTSAGKNFRWSAVYVFSPTEFTGLFELSGAGVNLLTDPDVTVTVPTGGFAIVINNAVHSSGVDSRLLYAYASENWVGAVSSAMSTSFLSNNINYAEQQGDGSYTGVYISPYDMELGTNTLGTTDPKIITGFSLYDYGFEPGLAQENTEIAINFTTEWAVGTALLTSSKVGQSMTLGELTGNNYWYWHLAVCEWSEADDAYVVTAKYNLFEDHTNVEIPAGGFILGVHSASADFGTFAGLKAGNKVYLYNVDPLYTKPGDTFADAYFSFPGASTEEGEVPVTPTPIAKMDVTNNNAFLADVVTLLTRVEGNAAATIGEISAIFEGDPEDYNYFYLAVVEWSDVNARYEITAKYDVLGRPAGEKTDVVVPADGFIIAVHGGVSGSGAFINSVEVGDAVYLYTDATDFAIIDSGARDELANTYFTVGKYDYSATVKYYVPDADTTAIDNAIDQIRNLDEADFTEETWADFIEAIEDYFFKLGGTLSVFGGVGPYVDDVTNLSDETEVGVGDLTLLVDGDKVSGAGNWGSFSGAVLFNNKVCTDELLNPTVELVLNLDEVRTIDKVILDFYHCYNVMIGLPRDNEVRLSYSVDGVSYTSLGTFTFDGAAAAGEYGVIEAVFDIGEVDAQYIGVEFNFGPSPFETDGKVVWEFISLTEVSVAEPVEVEPFSLQSLVDYIDAGGFDAEAQTLLDDAAIDIILAKNELVPNVILGDLDGDGEFTATDINLALNGIAGLAVLDIAQELAADVDGDGEFTATDINVMLNMIAGLIYDWPANN